MKIQEWQLDTRQGPPFSWEVLSSQLVLFHCTSILAFFPPPSSGSLPPAAPMAPDCTDLLSYSYGKVYFVFTTAESARAVTGMELGLPLGSTSKGQEPSLKQYSCNLFRNQKSSQYLRDILLQTILYPQVLVCHVLRLWGTCHHWLVPPGSSCSPLWLQQSQPEFFPTLLIPVIQSRRPDCLPLYDILAKSPLWNVQYMMKKYSS